MTTYEIITTLVSLLAVIVASVSLYRTREIASQQLELERTTSELSRKQLEIIAAEEKALQKAHIDVELEGYGADWRFVITNNGAAEASDVNFYLEGEGNPLVANDYAEKIPIRALKPGKSISIYAALSMGVPRQYTTNVRWNNPDGTQDKDSYIVSAN